MQTQQNKDVTTVELSRRLLEAGLRPSVQRLAVLGDLCHHYDHPTVDTIYSRLQPQMPTLSKTTVYNTLRVLCDAGLVRSLNIEYANQRFDGHLEPHDHFICTCCGRVYGNAGTSRHDSFCRNYFRARGLGAGLGSYRKFQRHRASR